MRIETKSLLHESLYISYFPVENIYTNNIITFVLTQTSGVQLGIDDEARAIFYCDLPIMHMDGIT